MDEWTRLARRARSGDPNGLEAFVRATQADVWRLCAHLGDREHADDLTQETYLRVFRGLHSFREDAPVRAWLFSIVRRVAADDIAARRRRRAEAGRAMLLPEAADPHETVSLGLLLDSLDDDRRLAFWLTQVVGYSYAEAADFCACPIGTIRSRVARAREQLVDQMDPARTRPGRRASGSSSGF